MKSRFFGLSAKLALAALAVGLTFTSCYDSANENVVVPVTPGEVVLPAPMYEITGYVTDFLTGNAIEGATVNTPLGVATTDGTGFYKVTSGSAASGQVEIAAAGYQTAKFNLTITEVKTGMSCYTVNAGLKKVGYVDGVVIDQLGTGTEKEVITEGLEALVMAERQREFFGEGKRWFDLVRYAQRKGGTYDMLNKYLGKKYTDNKNAIYAKLHKLQSLFSPVFLDEMKKNPLLHQNSVWITNESTSKTDEL